MRGKALYFTLFSIFYCGCNQPKSIHISRFGCKGTKIQWIGHREAHIFISINIVPDSDEGEEILFSVR